MSGNSVGHERPNSLDLSNFAGDVALGELQQRNYVELVRDRDIDWHEVECSVMKAFDGSIGHMLKVQQ